MQDTCRMCGEPAHYKFTHTILNRFQGRYFECGACGSLQTEQPYWLEEAYRIPGVHIDVGQAARVVQTWIRLSFLLERLGFERDEPAVDYGGSAGLLSRLMRDAGYSYFTYDRYEQAKYSNYFQVEQFGDISPKLITAFEVLEHFPAPAEQLAALLSNSVELVIFSTQFYEQQDADWDYLAPFCGQHVFFYSKRGLQEFAERHGFKLKRTADFWVLVRAGSRYLPVLEANRQQKMDAGFAGDFLLRIGYGTDRTLEDYAYAKERFRRELSTSPGRRKFGWSRLFRR